jgi:PPP family 3-phenylpropionic acid transporter
MASAARLRLVYFLYYANVGTFLPYFAAYLRGLGFTGEQIGTVQMVPSLLAPAAALSWAALADRSGEPVRVLSAAATWAALAVVFLPFARTPLQVGLVVVAQALGERAVVPLVDAVTLEHSRLRPRDPYARIRLFGSLGFIAFALLLGRLLTLRGNRPADVLVPGAVAAFVISYALAVRRLRAAPAADLDRPGAREMLGLLQHRPLLLLLGACAVHWAACAPFHLLFGVFIRDLGLPADVTGLGMAAGVVAEISVMMLFPRIEGRLPLPGLFAIAFLGSAARWALLARAHDPVEIVLLQLMHGLTFGLFWATTMKALALFVPPRLRATGQGLFTAVVFGAGNAAGYALSGVGYDRFRSAAPLYGWAAAVELAVGVAALAAFRSGAARSAASPADRLR